MFNEKQTLDLYFSKFPMNVQETPNSESFCFREAKILLREVYEPKCENWLKKQFGTKKLIGGEGERGTAEVQGKPEVNLRCPFSGAPHFGFGNKMAYFMKLVAHGFCLASGQ